MTVNIKLMKRDKNTPVPTRSNKDFSIFSNIILPFSVSVMSDINENRKKIKAFYPPVKFLGVSKELNHSFIV